MGIKKTASRTHVDEGTQGNMFEVSLGKSQPAERSHRPQNTDSKVKLPPKQEKERENSEEVKDKANNNE